MPHAPAPRAASQRGVTLIELMVGMVIGLLAVLVIAQVALLFEGQKRSTTGGSDAQVNGALTLQMLARDLQMSGYGITTGNGAGCEMRGLRSGVNPPWHGQPMAPVRIVQGTDATRGSPDTLFVMLSGRPGTSFHALPVRLSRVHKKGDVSIGVESTTNLGSETAQAGDLLALIPVNTATTWCSVVQVTATPAALADTIEHALTGAWNQDATANVQPGSTFDAVGYAVGDQFVNLGTLTYREYALGADTAAGGGTALTLRTTDASSAVWSAAEVVYPQIVNLQAVYGVDTTTTADRVVDSWTTTTPTTPDGWSRVLAVRVAVVARSTQYEKGEVTAAEPTWKPDGTTSEALKVDHLTDWKHYRYRVFEVVVPLRNMLWQS
ncbi:PilW family protein [Leptothrix sp. BB-4]